AGPGGEIEIRLVGNAQKIEKGSGHGGKVANANVSTWAAAVRRSNRRKRQNPISHPQMRNHVTRIQPAQTLSDHVHRLSARLLGNVALQLVRPVGDARSRAEPRNQDAVARGQKSPADPPEILHEGPSAESDLVVSEQAVNEDDRASQLRGNH